MLEIDVAYDNEQADLVTVGGTYGVGVPLARIGDAPTARDENVKKSEEKFNVSRLNAGEIVVAQHRQDIYEMNLRAMANILPGHNPIHVDAVLVYVY